MHYSCDVEIIICIWKVTNKRQFHYQRYLIGALGAFVVHKQLGGLFQGPLRTIMTAFPARWGWKELKDSSECVEGKVRAPFWHYCWRLEYFPCSTLSPSWWHSQHLRICCYWCQGLDLCLHFPFASCSQVLTCRIMVRSHNYFSQWCREGSSSGHELCLRGWLVESETRVAHDEVACSRLDHHLSCLYGFFLSGIVLIRLLKRPLDHPRIKNSTFCSWLCKHQHFLDSLVVFRNSSLGAQMVVLNAVQIGLFVAHVVVWRMASCIWRLHLDSCVLKPAIQLWQLMELLDFFCFVV